MGCCGGGACCDWSCCCDRSGNHLSCDCDAGGCSCDCGGPGAATKEYMPWPQAGAVSHVGNSYAEAPGADSYALCGRGPGSYMDAPGGHMPAGAGHGWDPP